MSPTKAPVNKTLGITNRRIKVKGLKPRASERVRKAMANVHTSMAVEGLKPSRLTVAYGRQLLEGKITGQEAITRIKTRYCAATGARNDK